MTIREIASIVNGALLLTEIPDTRNYEQAFASDLMSDVLTVDCIDLLLVTGLINTQTIRTAELSEIGCIILARNKKASAEMIRLASESNISLIQTPYSVFKVCGLLYEAGIRPVF